jgi:DNA adenine methylase
MIPYLGNKSSISDFLKQYIPKNPNKWIEPFGGGFGLYFNIDLKDYPDTKFIYNDINPLNCILFEHLKSDKFINKVKNTNITKEVFENSYNDIIDSESKRKSKKVIKSGSSEDKALSWLIILCCGDSKDLMNKEYKGNSSFEILKYKLSRYSEYFKRIEILNLDYKEILKQHDSEDTFFYLDPPYFGFEDYYVNNTFKGESHSELPKELKQLKGKWLLSYYKFDKLEDWYSNYKIVSKRNNNSEEFLILGV